MFLCRRTPRLRATMVDSFVGNNLKYVLVLEKTHVPSTAAQVRKKKIKIFPRRTHLSPYGLRPMFRTDRYCRFHRPHERSSHVNVARGSPNICRDVSISVRTCFLSDGVPRRRVISIENQLVTVITRALKLMT
jgi:hypothetical protein